MVKIKRLKTDNIVRVLLLLFIIYVIYQLIHTLLGGSWGFEELIIGLLIANLGYSFEISRRISELGSRLSEHLGEHKGYSNSYRIGKENN